MTNEKMQELADCLISKSVELNEDELEQVSGGVTTGGCILLPFPKRDPFKTIYYPTEPIISIDLGKNF
ncbi:MAG: hypothetical protein K2G36_04500 [Ruminococcus sp.]|nr:hypothetical protein [Ruminococcus sp.]